MPRLKWDEIGERLYETGVSDVALYKYNATEKKYGTGVAWNGVTSISETPSGGEPNPIYADNIKYLNLYSAEEIGGTIEAYMSPEEFDECDGSASIAEGVSIRQQGRATFGLVYKTKIGNDTEGDAHGYKLHVLYGAQASPSERSYASINESPEPATLSWEYTTTAVAVTGHKPTALVVIDSTKADATKLAALEAKLYGSEGETSSAPTLIMPDEIASIFSASQAQG